MKPTPIILDVDAGVDDTLAIILALSSQSLNLRAITTVAGNVPVRACTRNVLLTLEILSPYLHSLPVVAEGAAQPLKQRLFSAREVHGNDGIGNASRFYGRPMLKAVHGSAVDVILETVKQEPNLTLIATGPLTNIALAIARDRATMRSLREIVVMGGAFKGLHNTGPVAEFNFYTDPDAADLVMQSGIPIRLIPLNVTEKCIITPGDLNAITYAPLRRYVQRVTHFYFAFHKRTENFNGGYLHDPLAVAAVATPSLVKTEEGYVRVETGGKYSRGLSIFFPRLNPRKEAELPGWVKRALLHKPSVCVAKAVDAASFKRKFLAAIGNVR